MHNVRAPITGTSILVLLLITSCQKADEPERKPDIYLYSGMLYDTNGVGVPYQFIYADDQSQYDDTVYTESHGMFTGKIVWGRNPPPHYFSPPPSTKVFLFAGVGDQAGYHEFIYDDLSLTSTLQTDIHMVRAGWIDVELHDDSQHGEATLEVQYAADTGVFRHYNIAYTGHYDTTFHVRAYPQLPVRLKVTANGSSSEDTIAVNSGETVTRVFAF